MSQYTKRFQDALTLNTQTSAQKQFTKKNNRDEKKHREKKERRKTPFFRCGFSDHKSVVAMDAHLTSPSYNCSHAKQKQNQKILDMSTLDLI